MKRINLKSTSNLLSDKEMKSISGGRQIDVYCFWENPAGTPQCACSSEEAASHGGHWECNTATAFALCRDIDC